MQSTNYFSRTPPSHLKMMTLVTLWRVPPPKTRRVRRSGRRELMVRRGQQQGTRTLQPPSPLGPPQPGQLPSWTTLMPRHQLWVGVNWNKIIIILIIHYFLSEAPSSQPDQDKLDPCENITLSPPAQPTAQKVMVPPAIVNHPPAYHLDHNTN